MTLLVAPCSLEAARYAVERWHYSDGMPVGKLVKFGVWEHDAFIGAIVFGRGASPNYGKMFGLDQTEVCELVRVALTDHEAPVSQIVAEAVRQLKVTSPGLRLIVSFADTKEGHHGGIYQALGWVYAGTGQINREYWYEGRWRHNRNIEIGSYLHSIRHTLEFRETSDKHKYLHPLDRAMRRQLRPIAQPYPPANKETP